MSLPPGDRAHPRAQLLFTLVVACLGWGALAATALVPELRVPAPGGPGLFVLFVTVILAARTMAFRLVPESVLSLDSAFYVAAAICVGSVPAGRMVALALTLDALLRLVARGRSGGVRGRWREEAAYVLYFGGMTGALVMASAGVLHVDALAATDSQAVIALRVLAVGAVLLVSHYAVQGVRSALGGRRVPSYLREVALPGIISEASLLPAAVVLVLLYRPDELFAFGLVCATYLLVNFVFNRLSSASSALRRRVRELEVLDTTARRLAASLQLQELVETVARETVRAIPEAEVVALAHSPVSSGPVAGERGTADRFVVDAYDRARDSFERVYVGRDEGVTGRVVREQQPVLAEDVGGGVRSWLGVPVFMYGGCDGVLSVQSRAGAAFGADHQRLLESIALQVAAALQNAHLYEMAMVDGLTGLFVRRYFDARSEEEIERARRYGSEFSVVMMDVDDFKLLNDTHGHQVGDRVLRAVAQIVKGNMRGVDTAARYGGEEIALILPRTGMVAAYNQAERIRSAIADHRLATDDGSVIRVTASFGIAAFPESRATSAEDLVKRADRALYRAKKTGKNRVELFWADEGQRLGTEPPDSITDQPSAPATGRGIAAS